MSMWTDAMCIEDKYDQFGDEEELQKKYNGRYPKEIIEETEDLDFVLYILYDKCKKLSKEGAMYSKIQRCIKHLEFLKEADDKITWLERDIAMSKATHEEIIENLSKQLKGNGIEPEY